MSKVEVLFGLLVDMMNDTMRMIEKVEFNKGSRVHRAVMALYASIIEHTDSAMILHSNRRAAGIDTILRTNLEAFVDLANLCNDPDYYNQMLALYHKDWLALTKGGLDGNPFLDFFKEEPGSADRVEYHKAALAELQKLGPTLSVFERFQLAGMENEYRSVYKDLCGHSHNNIKSLSDQHFVGDTGDSLEVVIFAEKGKEALLSSLDQFIAILGRAGYLVHDYFKSPVAKEAATLTARRKELQSFFDEETGPEVAA
ncbi:DUF5677 domain-containing protein [Mesorhizobium sp.]|uniref:DUF5677 domain-containing protein n=1 Tax=Mesorhizobium sp. TaxID=1871066 RepID=UPI000FE91A9C|nr:DUF5677 domain-containing protein [Mesorhizobium sp.]RWE79207.1 MAG: hypothetical protein EOS42_02615 [Mesorhizobium sp.]TIV32268.1 MAG: hypothetical protein E5V90_03890 [Mesorhizobium sp.]